MQVLATFIYVDNNCVLLMVKNSTFNLETLLTSSLQTSLQTMELSTFINVDITNNDTIHRKKLQR